MKKIIRGLAALLFAAGFAMLAYPLLGELRQEAENRQMIQAFEQKKTAGEEVAETISVLESSAGSYENNSLPYTDLLERMRVYNEKIYEEKQSSLCDAFSYQQNVFNFQSYGIYEDMIGYIKIDAMNIEVPLYIGANEENLRKAAVVLSQTSMPIGGENTNCVIAAHRGGYNGQAMFRDIEVLKQGDIIEITNLWETLQYEVAKCIVITPDDIDAVKIIPGQDMVTLVTCHPYGNNYQRYVVYCTRVQDDGATDGEALTQAAQKIPFDGIDYESSSEQIQMEVMMNRIGLIAFGGIALILIAGLGIGAVRRKNVKNRLEKFSQRRRRFKA